MTIVTELIIAGVVLFLFIGIATKGRFFFALRNRAAAFAEDAADAVRDPVADGQMAIVDARRDIDQLKRERTQAREDVLGIERDLKEARETVDKFERLAKNAGSKNDGAAVRECLGRKGTAEKDVKLLEGQVTELNGLIASISATIEEREREIDEAENSSKTLVRSLKYNKIKARISQSKVNRDGPNQSLERLKKDAADMAIKSQVADEDAGRGSIVDDLEKRFGDDRSGVTDDDVAAYMSKPVEQA